MTEREKNLLLVGGGIILLFGILFGFRIYKDKMAALESALSTAETELMIREAYLETSADELQQDANWLTANEGDPVTEETAQSQLLNFAQSEAEARGLEIKRREPRATDQSGVHYHTVKIAFDVQGKEADVYQWLARLNSPRDFRTVEFFRIAPPKSNRELVDLSVVIEKYFIPDGYEATEETSSNGVPFPVRLNQ